jgi:hypothetical protein
LRRVGVGEIVEIKMKKMNGNDAEQIPRIKKHNGAKFECFYEPKKGLRLFTSQP